MTGVYLYKAFQYVGDLLFAEKRINPLKVLPDSGRKTTIETHILSKCYDIIKYRRRQYSEYYIFSIFRFDF